MGSGMRRRRRKIRNKENREWIGRTVVGAGAVVRNQKERTEVGSGCGSWIRRVGYDIGRGLR